MEMRTKLVLWSERFKRRVESMSISQTASNRNFYAIFSIYSISENETWKIWNRITQTSIRYDNEYSHFHFSLVLFVDSASVPRTMFNCKANSAECDTPSKRKWSVINLLTPMFCSDFFSSSLHFFVSAFWWFQRCCASKQFLLCSIEMEKKMAFVWLVLLPYLMGFFLWIVYIA